MYSSGLDAELLSAESRTQLIEVTSLLKRSIFQQFLDDRIELGLPHEWGEVDPRGLRLLVSSNSLLFADI